MKVIHLLIAMTVVFAFSCNNANKEANLKTFNDTLSYSIGKDLGKNFERNQIDSVINPQLIALGIRDYFNEDSIVMTEEDVNEFLNSYMMQKREEAEQKRIEDNKIKFKKELEEGKKYLEENANKEGVNITESGLQFKVLKEGNGNKPGATDKVKVHYEGKLIDGTVFDSSYDRGEPAEFVLVQVVKGWSEGLQLMKEGSIYELIIPYELGYGDRGSGNIKPFSTLIFKVELIEIVDKK